MPIQTIRDPKTGEERRVYVSSGGMGAGAPPKPRPQPRPPAGGGFMGTLNDFNPMKQIGALGTGISTFMQTGDLNKSIAAASKEAAPTTALGQSVNRTLSAGGQRAVDAARLEIDRARLAREQIAAGTSPMDVRIPATGPGAPSAQRVRLPEWANYDDVRVEPKNPVEDVAASIVGFVPYFAVARGAGAPAQALICWPESSWWRQACCRHLCGRSCLWCHPWCHCHLLRHQAHRQDAERQLGRDGQRHTV